MKCYRDGGCGPYEMYSCSECPASKPEYLIRNNKEAYYDDVGGFHDCAEGWNPNGVWCGECTMLSCRDCSSRDLIE